MSEQWTLDDIDPDLEWVEREIRKCEDGPRQSAFDTPNLNRLRNERLDQLKKFRQKLLGNGMEA